MDKRMLTMPVEEPIYLTPQKRMKIRESLAKVILAITNAAIDNTSIAGDSLAELNKVMDMV